MKAVTWQGDGPQSPLLRLSHRLERAAVLDAPARAAERIVGAALPRGPARELVRGGWLGHALHPLLTDVPIGAWTSSLVLDLIGGRDSEAAADLLIGVGVVAVAPTALTGWSDWSETGTEQRRVGLVHAGANIAAATLFATSLVQRRRGDRAKGKLTSLLATAALSMGGFLGGHLAYAQAAGAGER